MFNINSVFFGKWKHVMFGNYHTLCIQALILNQEYLYWWDWYLLVFNPLQHTLQFIVIHEYIHPRFQHSHW